MRDSDGALGRRLYKVIKILIQIDLLTQKPALTSNGEEIVLEPNLSDRGPGIMELGYPGSMFPHGSSFRAATQSKS